VAYDIMSDREERMARYDDMPPLGRLRLHHLLIPIALAMMAVGLALVSAAPMSFAETLGPDLVSAIGGVLIVFGLFSIASYVVVRAIEWADRPRRPPRA
jgi:hypothetical protein